MISFCLQLEPHFHEIDFSKCGKNVVYPMDLMKMSTNIDNKQYQCWEAFSSDIKWIAHNTKARNERKKYAHKR